MMNYSGIIPNDTAAAPGICVTLFVSGCPLHCKGCHNQDMWDPQCGKPFTDQTLSHILDLLSANGVNRSLCIMGGEPFASYNIDSVNNIIQQIKKHSPQTKIFVWTGYVLEELELCKNASIKEALSAIDCLIDGPYIEKERDVTLPMRGSSNQRIIYAVH